VPLPLVKGTRYTDAVDKPPHPFEASLSLNADPDATSRARVLRDALNAVPDFQRWLRLARQRAMAEMSAAGMSYREIGKELGISHTRVQQILEGRVAGHHVATQAEPSAPTGGGE
jgi:DNA-directed RNA polymerase specialized sigma24 family protein